jgi:hypothetical protein
MVPQKLQNGRIAESERGKGRIKDGNGEKVEEMKR